MNYRRIPSDAGYAFERDDTGSKILVSNSLENGTIVQAASADEFADFAAFQVAIKALPLKFKLEPLPTFSITTLRGKEITFTYGEAPVVD